MQADRDSKSRGVRHAFGSWATGLFVCVITNTPALAAEQPIDFNRDIRPILAENCFYCHGQDANRRQAELRLDLRDAAVKAGAIVPGDTTGSELLQRIGSDDPDVVMPPRRSNRRLSAEQKKLLERWVREGAPYSTHWALVPPVRPGIPSVRKSEWPRNSIDRFVLAKLESSGLAPSPEADRTTLVKRLSIDLIGLPPTPEEIDAFVRDETPNAYERLVDRLLASPRYGERMAFPWLDAARYADSNGFQQDGDTWQWIWRDWLVKALNADLPFDQMTIKMLAGDLLPNATLEDKIAGGFNRNHLLNGEGGAIPEEQRFVNLFDRVDTTSTTWLGLTMACAQCHDHKYDPITTRDYYSLLDAFNRLPETGVPRFFSSRIRVAAPFVETPTPENIRRLAEMEAGIKSAEAEARPFADAAFEGWRAGVLAGGIPPAGTSLPGELVGILKKPEKDRSENDKKTLESGLRSHFDTKIKSGLSGRLPILAKAETIRRELNDYRNDQIPRVMIMSDDQPRQTAILARGEYLNPREKVKFAVPAFLPPLPKDAPPNRLGLARWLVMPEHPLTARVQVNRIWQHYFGAGIVKTSEDFGVQSEFPVHGELLDWLSVEFRERGWSLKTMHRLIVTSATYRQSSKLTNITKAKDPENRLYARASRFRMPSPILRDWALAASGLLDDRIGGRPVYPYQPDAIWEALAITKERDFTYPTSKGPDLHRRSLYTFWRRTVAPANMFDTSNRQTCRVRSSTTSTPLHALTTLNDPTWVEAARVLAGRCMTISGSTDEQLAAAFRRVLCREPNETERGILRRALESQIKLFATNPGGAEKLLGVGDSERDRAIDTGRHAAFTAVCLSLLNLDEALTRE